VEGDSWRAIREGRFVKGKNNYFNVYQSLRSVNIFLMFVFSGLIRIKYSYVIY